MDILKFYIKKFWVLFLFILPSLVFFFLCVIRTNRAIILKGDTTLFTSVINIHTENEQKGSFSTIYVYNVEKATLFQNFIAEHSAISESYKMSATSTHISGMESYHAGKIQYNSSIGNALVLAYSEAEKVDPSIKLDYKFIGYQITYYGINSSFRIGDLIKGIYSKTYGSTVMVDDDVNLYKEVLTNYERGDEDYFIISRNGTMMNIPYIKNVNTFNAYGIYEYNSIKSNPSFDVSSNFIGGPSGGLLQALSIYNQLVSEDLTHGLRIAGTGTISPDGKVGIIGGIKEKIPTAFDDKMDIFFCAKGNIEEAKEAYNRLPNQNMKLIEIETFYDALNYLKEGYKNDFGSEE